MTDQTCDKEIQSGHFLGKTLLLLEFDFLIKLQCILHDKFCLSWDVIPYDTVTPWLMPFPVLNKLSRIPAKIDIPDDGILYRP